MIPVYQKVAGSERGDCYSACVASLLELRLEQVPNFHDLMQHEDAEWGYVVSKWLRAWGYWHIIVSWTPEFDEDTHAYGTGPYILSGRSPRIDSYHAVIAERGGIVHDPSPDGGGLRKPTEKYPWYVEVLVPYDYTGRSRDQVWVDALKQHSPRFRASLENVGWGDPYSAALSAIHAESRHTALHVLQKVIDRAERANEPITRDWAKSRFRATY